MKIRNALVATTLAAALLGGGAMPAASQNYPMQQNWDNPLAGSDPFEQETAAGRDWYEGPMNVWREGLVSRYGNPRGQEFFLEGDRWNRGAYDRGYQQGRAEERMMRDRSMRDQVMRDREESRMIYSEARNYLDVARRQIERGDLRAAWVALGRAETRLITRAAGRGAQGEQAAAGGAIGAIREARGALENRNADRAMDLVQTAENRVQRGLIIGETVSGRLLSGAGFPGEGQPLRNQRTGGN
jgi:hypothetical protein